MKLYILFFLLMICVFPIFSNKTFYYKDSIGSLRIDPNFQRNINGDIDGNKDSLYSIVVNDKSLSINEKLNLLDSISPSIQKIINGDTVKQINAVEKERQKSNNIYKLIRLFSFIIVSVSILYIIFKRKNKKRK